MLFYKEYTFVTKFSKEEVIRKVKELKKPSEKRAWIFEGKVGIDVFTFVAQFYPGDYRGFMPEVYGCITEGNKIILKQRLPLALKILFYIAILFNGSICLYCLFLETHMELVIALPICAFLFFSMLLVEFHQRGNRMIQILITKLKLKKI
jgi:hypothetical protein